MQEPTCQSKTANYKLEKLFVIRVKILNIKSSQEVNLSEAQKLTQKVHIQLHRIKKYKLKHGHCFCLLISEDKNKSWREQDWELLLLVSWESSAMGRKQGAWRPASKAFFMLVTPSKPVMSLLKNSLKEIIRFVHNNVLENREKHPILFQ